MFNGYSNYETYNFISHFKDVLIQAYNQNVFKDEVELKDFAYDEFVYSPSDNLWEFDIKNYVFGKINFNEILQKIKNEVKNG